MSSLNRLNDSTELKNLKFEEFVNFSEWQLWLNNNWIMTVYFTFIYGVVIISLKSYMRDRKPFELRKPLVVWNACLAMYSIAGTVCVLANLFYIKFDNQFWYKTICTRDYSTPLMDFFELIFVWSKVVELGDTVFIVLRKKPLMLLHWYHHVTVLCIVWMVVSEGASVNNWMGRMNYFIHSIMYTYYALTALQIRIPRSIPLAITSLQLGQMAIGVGVNLFVVYENYQRNRPCDTKLSHGYILLMMYGSYLLLFINFFRKSYFCKKTIKTL